MTTRRRRILIALGVVAAAAAVGLVYDAYIVFNRVEEAENVPRVDWLPPAARNVSCFRSYSFTAYEFDIDEPGFLAWARDNGWPAEPIGSTEFTVPRYSFDRSNRLYPRDDAALSDEEWEARYKRAQAARAKDIRRGYRYERRQSNGGGVTVGYDLDGGRAYYQSSPR